eukprot:g852.t1
MSLSSDELNLLVYRYLQESGFVHSAFTFAYESLVAKSSVSNKQIPPGSLISLVQKGLQLIDIESTLNDDGTERISDVSKRNNLQKDVNAEVEMADSSELIPTDEVSVLTGHSSEVFICRWNPKVDVLVSGSGDSTARLWQIPKGASGMASGHIASECPIVLQSYGVSVGKSKDVTAVDWNKAGTLFATGSYDGVAQIWSGHGEKMATLNQHQGPIFSLKFSPSGKLLLTGGIDKSAIVWSIPSGKVVRCFDIHASPTLDVDWKDDTYFATCSSDRTIKICDCNQNEPVCTFMGHKDEVNSIKWDPSGSFLVSASDDCTAKLWKMGDESILQPIQSFEGHTKEIYTIKWCPTQLSNRSTCIATGSFDATIKIWSTDTGICLHTLQRHTNPVYAISFSPNGKYLASGSFDQYLHVWSVEHGTLLRSFRGEGGIFDVDWNSSGSKIAATFSNNSICVLDFRK